MKIAVIGAGGVGGFYGGLLARAGHDVTFVARGEQFKALTTSGLSIKSVDDEFHIAPVKVVERISELSSPYLVMLATKTYDRDAVAAELSKVCDDSTVIISLLNGIDNDLLIKKFISKGRVLAGLTYIISARTAPGRIEQTAGPRTIFFGERKKEPDKELKEIEAVFKSARILATAASDIERELWEKFLWITTFSGMTAICSSSIGPIVNDPSTFELYVKCLDEGISVANALGVSLPYDLRTRLLKKSEDYRTSGTHAKSSLLVDIENRRPTEIEALSGSMVRLGHEAGVKTPLHQMIFEGIKTACKSYL